MKITQKIQAPEGDTLIFVTDSTRAKWYTLKDRELEKVGSFVRQKPTYTDREGFSGSKRALRSGGGTLDSVEDHEEKMYWKEAARHLTEAATLAKVRHIIVSAPPRMKHHLHDLLSTDVQKKILLWHDGNLYRTQGMKITELLLKQLFG